MITSEVAMNAVRSMAVIPFFPSDEFAQTTIMNEVAAMCETTQQAQWLVKKMIRIYSSWPGPREMRACFCSKFRPADGFEVGSTVYPDGIPSDKEQLPQIAAPEHLSLPPGESRDMVRTLAAAYTRLPIHVQTEPSPPPKPKPEPINITPEGTHPAQIPCGCFGTGRKGLGSYCSCPMGVDLYRIENKDRAEFDQHQNEVRAELESMGL